MYRTGTTKEDKDFADIVFKINMYSTIEHRFWLNDYSWKRLEKARKIMADLFYKAVSTMGDKAFFTKEKEINHGSR